MPGGEDTTSVSSDMAATKLDLCYQYLHGHLIINTALGLPFFVNRDFHPKTRLSVTLSYVYQYVTEIWLLLGLISGVIGVIIVWNEENILFGGLSSTSHMTQITLKLLLLNLKKDKFLQQLRKLNEIFEKNALLKIDAKIPDFVMFSSGPLRRIAIFCSVMLTINLTWTTVYFAPYAYNSIFHWDSLEGMHSPIVGYIPFEFMVTPLFQMVVIFQAILFYIANLKTTAVDYFILGFLVIHILQFRYLNLTLEKATEILEKKKRDKGVDLKLDTFLVNWTKQHQDSVRAVRTSIELLSLYCLVEFWYMIVHTCVPAFVITSTLSWTLNEKIVLVVMCTGGIINLYLLSLCGDTFHDSSEEYGVTFYGPHLFDEKKHQLMYKMLLHMSRNRAKVFGFSNVYPLCSITFAAIMRTVMSCYLALKQIKEIKNDE